MPTEGTRPMDNCYGKPYTKCLSEDGRDRTKPIPEVKPGRRYIYYRLYTKDGPLESKHPIYSNDRFIGRIASTLVRPPHTAASLTRCLCKTEGLEHRKSALYQSLSDNTALDDSIHLSLRVTPGPGSSDVDPVALILDTRAAENGLQASRSVESQKLLERNYEPRYVYYRVYDDDSGAVPKTSFDEDDRYLGRVNTLSVPPPYTVSCLKNFIIRSESISGHNVLLFEDEGSESAMNDSDPLTLLSDTFPGSIEDQPIVITYELGTTNGSADNGDPLRKGREALAQIKKEFEKAKRTHEREMNEALSSLNQLQAQLPSTFTKKLRAKDDSNWDPDTRWHSLKAGEIFYTDGIYMGEHWWTRDYDRAYGCYLATNSVGKLAFIGKDYVVFC